MTISQDYSIDSLRYRIPLNDCKNVNPILSSEILEVNSHTSEIEAIKPRSEKRGNLIFKLGKSRFAGRGNMSCLSIAIPSKILRQDYFDGISNDNILKVFGAIMSTGLVDVSFDAFLNASAVSDVDIKQDLDFYQSPFYPEYQKQSDLFRAIKKASIPSTDKRKGATLYNKRENVGIDFGSRQTASIGYPFFKMYSKITELKSPRGIAFTSKYLGHLDLSDSNQIMRSEVTVKNKKHFESIVGNFDTSLKSLLGLSQTDLKKLMTHAYDIHVNKLTATRTRNTDGLKPRDQAILNLIAFCTEQGLSKYAIQSRFIDNIECRRSRARMLKLFDELYCNYVFVGDNSEKMTTCFG